ncbi:MAG: GatB/YqeY domain-containing protein [Leptospira sp.]|nr:GatB/YqeY domain-containing protein [Leptospira sp.]
MPTIQETIYQDLKSALKNKKEPELSTLRLLKTEIQYELTKTGATEIPDITMIPLLKKNVSQRQESSKEYRNANRIDLAEKEEREMEVILHYLPAEISMEEIDRVIQESIAILKPTGPQDTGKLMGKVMQSFKGKNIDGSKVSDAVKKALQAIV